MSHRTKRISRVFVAALGFFGAVFLPPYVPMAAIAVLALLSAGWEVPLLGLFVDLLWLPAGGMLHPLPMFTLASIVAVWGLEPLRREFLLQ